MIVRRVTTTLKAVGHENPPMNRRGFVRTALTAASVGSLSGCAFLEGAATNDDPDGTEPATETEATTSMPDLQFRPTAFEAGETIPERFTCDGEDSSPPLAIEGVNEEAESLAIVVDDPDAPSGTFTHWLLWNVPADTTELPEDVATTETIEELDGARQGTNDFGEVGYRGPCPPKGDDPHTYHFTLYALGDPIRVGAGAKREETLEAIEDVQVGKTEFTAPYGR